MIIPHVPVLRAATITQQSSTSPELPVRQSVFSPLIPNKAPSWKLPVVRKTPERLSEKTFTQLNTMAAIGRPSWYATRPVTIQQQYDKLESRAADAEIRAMERRLVPALDDTALRSLALQKRLNESGFATLKAAEVVVRYGDLASPYFGGLAYPTTPAPTYLKEVSLLEMTQPGGNPISRPEYGNAQVFIQDADGHLTPYPQMTAEQARTISASVDVGRDQRESILSNYFPGAWQPETLFHFEGFTSSSLDQPTHLGINGLWDSVLDPLLPAPEIAEQYHSRAQLDLFDTRQQVPFFSQGAITSFTQAIDNHPGTERHIVKIAQRPIHNLFMLKTADSPGVVLHFANSPPSGPPLREFSSSKEALEWLEVKTIGSEAWQTFIVDNSDALSTDSNRALWNQQRPMGFLFETSPIQTSISHQIAKAKAIDEARLSAGFVSSRLGSTEAEQRENLQNLGGMALRSVPILGTFLLAADAAKNVDDTINAFKTGKGAEGTQHVAELLLTLVDLVFSLAPLKPPTAALNAMRRLNRQVLRTSLRTVGPNTSIKGLFTQLKTLGKEAGRKSVPPPLVSTKASPGQLSTSPAGKPLKTLERLPHPAPPGMLEVTLDGDRFLVNQKPNILKHYELYRQSPNGATTSAGQYARKGADGQWSRLGLKGGGNESLPSAIASETGTANLDIATSSSATTTGWTRPNSVPAFEPIKLPYVPTSVSKPLSAWSWKNYLGATEKKSLEQLISETFNIPRIELVIKDASMADIAKRLGTPLDTHNLAANPIAWTAPSGEILIAVDHPDFSSFPGQSRAKILSTLVHESLHASSFEHRGLQRLTDTHLANTNIDEFVTDYFAHDIYKKLFPDQPYLTAYFAKDLGSEPTLWGGNLAKFMFERGSMTPEQLSHAYFKGPHTFKPPSSEVLQQWQSLAKRRVVRPRENGRGL